MREIKFRAWKHIGKRWANAVELQSQLPVKCFYRPQAVLSYGNEEQIYAINLYTGLIDKNGRDIYAGDIVKISYENGPKEWARHEGVVFQRGCFMAGNENLLVNVINVCEVVGNIYENPELLEVKE